MKRFSGRGGLHRVFNPFGGGHSGARWAGRLALLLVWSSGNFAGSQQLSDRVTQEEVRDILTRAAKDFRERPPFALDYEMNFEFLLDEDALQAGQEIPPYIKYLPKGGRSVGQIRYDATRAESISKGYTRPRETGELYHNADRHYLWETDRNFLIVRGFTPEGASNGARASFIRNSRVHQVHEDIRPDETGWFADGLLVDSDHFGETLLNAEGLVGEREVLAQFGEVLRIEGRVPLGHLQVWLRPGDPPAWVKAHFKAEGEYLTENDMEELEFSVTILESEIIDGHRIVTKAFREESFQLKGGFHLGRTYALTRKNVQFNPDFEAMGAFFLDIPEGATVTDGDLSSQFIWKNGELVPKIDPRMEASLANLVEKTIASATVPEEAPPPQTPPVVPPRVAPVVEAATSASSISDEGQSASRTAVVAIVGAIAALLIGGAFFAAKRRG